MRKGWRAEDGALIFNGNGRSLCTDKDYGDFEMLVDWKISPNGDSGNLPAAARRKCRFGIRFAKPPHAGSEFWLGAASSTIRKTRPDR